MFILTIHEVCSSSISLFIREVDLVVADWSFRKVKPPLTTSAEGLSTKTSKKRFWPKTGILGHFGAKNR